MLFTDQLFLLLYLPIAWITYLLLRVYRSGKFVLQSLSIASVAFYALGDAPALVVLGTSILVNYNLSVLITRCQDPAWKRRILYIGLLFNLSLLGYFKYYNFVAGVILGVFGTPLPSALSWLPLGISFFTFTQIAYLVDTYTEPPPKTNFLNYALFVTFFPHLIAGPIIHHREVMPQFGALRIKRLHFKSVIAGLFLFSIGLLKKILLADPLAQWVDPAFRQVAELGLADAWLLSLSYSLQLYFDFSGYADMAVGLGLMFGISLPFNFASPYRATSIQEFWRRWHITLSRWLRTYIYVPLGGSRGQKTGVLSRLVLTFLLGGLWHGAGWTFLAWGALHGIGIALHRIHVWAGFRLPNVAGVGVTFLFVNVCWIFFRAPNIDSALLIVAAMCGLGQNDPLSFYGLDWALLSEVFIGLLIAFGTPNSQSLTFNDRSFSVRHRAAIIGLTLALGLVQGNAGYKSPFLYSYF